MEEEGVGLRALVSDSQLNGRVLPSTTRVTNLVPLLVPDTRRDRMRDCEEH